MDGDRANELARSFQQGQLSSFRLLVEGLSRRLIAMAYRYTQDWEVARDLCQETWIRVYQRIEQYDPDQPFGPWLVVVHRNLCLSHLRRSARWRELTAGSETMARLEIADPGGDPSTHLERQDFGVRLRAAMAGLTSSQRRVFEQVDLQEGDQEEAARILGMKASTLRSTLHFARRRLARLLLKMEEET